MCVLPVCAALDLVAVDLVEVDAGFVALGDVLAAVLWAVAVVVAGTVLVDVGSPVEL